MEIVFNQDVSGYLDNDNSNAVNIRFKSAL